MLQVLCPTVINLYYLGIDSTWYVEAYTRDTSWSWAVQPARVILLSAEISVSTVAEFNTTVCSILLYIIITYYVMYNIILISRYNSTCGGFNANITRWTNHQNSVHNGTHIVAYNNCFCSIVITDIIHIVQQYYDSCIIVSAIASRLDYVQFHMRFVQNYPRRFT